MEELLPRVLQNALREYKFASSPLWRLSDGRDLVKAELTFRKTTIVTKRAASRDRGPTRFHSTIRKLKPSAPSVGEWPRQPRPASQPEHARRRSTPEKETPPPTMQTQPTETASTILNELKEKIAI